MRPALVVDATLLLLLNPVVTDGLGDVDRFADLDTIVELVPTVSVGRPNTGEESGLQLEGNIVLVRVVQVTLLELRQGVEI